MSIRLLAQELYRLTREVTRLEEALAVVAPGDRDRIAEALRKARAERNRLRSALDGAKADGGSSGRSGVRS